MPRSYCDEIVNYPYTAKLKLAQSKNVVSFLLDNPDVDVSDVKTELALESCLFDFDYVDEMIQKASSFVCIDTQLDFPTKSMKDITISILVGVSCEIMKLDSSKWQGVKGNRRDNLVREIETVLHNSDAFGIGPLELITIRSVTVNNNFSCKSLLYKVPNFASGGFNLDP